MSVDVIIIGAGISGLACAKYLREKSRDLKLLILEAKDRVGGRTLTVPLKTKDGGTEMFDLGAHWVSRCQPHIMELVEEFGLETHEQYLKGRKFLQVASNNAVKSYTSDIPTLSLWALLDLDRAMKKLDSLAKEINQENPIEHDKGEEFDSTSLESYMNSTMWMADSKETLRFATRSVLGVEPADISLLYFLTYINSAGGLKYLLEATPYTAQEYTLNGGTQQISERIAKSLGNDCIKLSTPVDIITQKDDGVVVKTESGNSYRGKKLVLAIPPTQIGKLTFEPGLPTVKKELIKRTFMANFVKVILTFKTAFWRDDGSSGEFLSHGGPSPVQSCKFGPVSFSFDDTTVNGSPALVTFLTGSRAIEWREVEPNDKREAVLAGLEQFFGKKVHDYVDYIEKDWDDEPYCCGAPVNCVSTGGMKYYADGLRKPFGHIHMAGTETATIWAGYLSGAVQAGRRAAIEILQNIRPGSVSAVDIQKNNTPFKK